MRRMSPVGDMKMRMNPLGNRKTSSVHTALKKAAAISAYFSAARMRPHLPAPKLAERMGWAAWPTLYAQHWTMVLTFTITPYTASASVPSPCRIWRLNSMVRMPMAMSRKNVEKPVVRICRSLVPAFRKRTGRSVQRREKKWDSITVKVMPEPMAVASPAPNTPMSQVNTKK